MWYQNNQPTVAAPNENFRTKCVIGIDRDGVINEDLGTGWATSFETVADVLTSHITGKKTYIAMPQDLKSQYQTHTQADTTDLINAGVNVSEFRSIHAGVAEYLDFLKVNRYY
jgi:ADP-L-glycero-D-manno-heptose 6-epimerase